MDFVNLISLSTEGKVLEALEIIQNHHTRVVLVLDDQMRLLGTVTDGDIRRGILRGVTVNDTVTRVMNENPIFIYKEEVISASLINDCEAKGIAVVPVLQKEDSRVLRVESIESLLAPKERENAVVLMAGGLGSRLGELTKECPKPMLNIGQDPILHTIVERLKQFGFHRFFFSVNYKSEVIENYFGDGSKFGVSIDYLRETKRMGTAGSLSLLPKDVCDKPLLVMNADLLTKVDFGSLIDFHLEQKSDASMCIREYDVKIPYGVINLDGDTIHSIEEKPVHRFFVNAGIYTLSSKAIDLIPEDEYFDMPQLFNELTNKKMTTKVFPVGEYWIDVGKVDDYKKASSEYELHFISNKE